MRHGEIGTHAELKEKYGLSGENRPVIKLDPALVPEDLRDLIPLAEKWGVGDDIIRSDIEDGATESEKRDLMSKVNGRLERINAWIDSFSHADAMTDEAAAFMYLALAVDEMGLWNGTSPVE